MLSILLINVYIIMAILVQLVDNTDLSNVSDNLNISLSNAFPKSESHSIGNFVNNKNIYKNSLLMENLSNAKYRRDISGISNTVDSTVNQLKRVLPKFLFSENDQQLQKREVSLSDLNVEKKKLKRNERKRSGEHPKWRNWTKWSTCSVTCGKGREIRWRHCKENCKEVEIEMEEKACQLPACPQKLFGLIKL